MEFGSLGGEEHDEHNGVGFMEIFEIFVTHDASFDGVY